MQNRDPHDLLAAILAALSQHPDLADFTDWFATTNTGLAAVLAFQEVENRPGHSALGEARRERRNQLIRAVATNLIGSPRQRAMAILDAARPSRQLPRDRDFAELVEELRRNPLGERMLEKLMPRN
jgi:hypothetical protein